MEAAVFRSVEPHRRVSLLHILDWTKRTPGAFDIAHASRSHTRSNQPRSTASGPVDTLKKRAMVGICRRLPLAHSEEDTTQVAFIMLPDRGSDPHDDFRHATSAASAPGQRNDDTIEGVARRSSEKLGRSGSSVWQFNHEHPHSAIRFVTPADGHQSLGRPRAIPCHPLPSPTIPYHPLPSPPSLLEAEESPALVHQ